MPGKPWGMPKAFVLGPALPELLLSSRFWKALFKACRAGFELMLLEPLLGVIGDPELSEEDPLLTNCPNRFCTLDAREE